MAGENKGNEMRTVDDFTRPLEYLAPVDKFLGEIVRAWAEREVMPHRRRCTRNRTSIARRASTPTSAIQLWT